jgi:hypothetical protein
MLLLRDSRVEDEAEIDVLLLVSEQKFNVSRLDTAATGGVQKTGVQPAQSPSQVQKYNSYLSGPRHNPTSHAERQIRDVTMW